MARNRQSVPRDERIDSILDISESILIDSGFNAMTIAAVARSAGLAPNAIVWYFGSRDELLAATLKRRLTLCTAHLHTSSRWSGRRRLKEFVDYWTPYRSVYATMLSRAPRSGHVADVHAEILRYISDLAESIAGDGVTRGEHDRRILAISLLAEGCLVNGYPGARLLALTDDYVR